MIPAACADANGEPTARDLRIAGAAGLGAARLISTSQQARVLAGCSTEGAAAIKIASERTMADPLGRARFAREGRVGLGLTHPSLVRTLRHGDDWILLRQVGLAASPAPTLAGRIATTGALPGAEAERGIAAIAGALALMHARGLVHRDVKPANVLVDAGGDWVLIDLGAVGFAVADALDGAEAIGSPAWMAPEQMEGCAAHSSQDSWALAMLAVHALTGLSAYGGGAGDVLRRRRCDDDACRTLAGRALARASPRLADLIVSALAADPDSRPPARAFARLGLEDPACDVADYASSRARYGR